MTSDSSIAIVRFDKEQNVDSVLAGAAKMLKQRGYRASGFLQREQDENGSGCCTDVFLEDIGSGNRFQITQSLGAGSKGCRLDPAGLVEAVSHMTQQINDQVDVLFLNRFGKGEEDGRGFRPVIESAFMLGIPTLIAVRDAYLDSFMQFCGDDYTTLPVNAEDIAIWVQKRCPQPELLQSA